MCIHIAIFASFYVKKITTGNDTHTLCVIVNKTSSKNCIYTRYKTQLKIIRFSETTIAWIGIENLLISMLEYQKENRLEDSIGKKTKFLLMYIM